MSKTEGADISEPESFDLEAWIDGIIRPELTVALYPYEVDFIARSQALIAKIEAAGEVGPEDRGMDDATAAIYQIELDELKAERDKVSLLVRVSEITDKEIVAIRDQAKEDGLDEEATQMRLIAAACVEPKFTAEQLATMRDKTRSGVVMVNQLSAAVLALLRGLPVPTSPAA